MGSVSGESVPNASVSNLSTGSSVQTDEQGRFQIEGQVGQQLRVTIVGFDPRTLTVDSYNKEISLDPRDEALEEVVVVGYGTQKKVNLTGAVATLFGDELESRHIANVGQGLQGQLPGLTIKNNNTGPGNSAPQIRIRGIGTWGDANPLIVINGIPGGNMNILNPDDIENISVLKDAASSSIYGVRGANGVILVTTKIGKSGTPTLNFNSYYGWQTPTALPKFLGSVDYMILQNEANQNAGQGPTYSQDQVYPLNTVRVNPIRKLEWEGLTAFIPLQQVAHSTLLEEVQLRVQNKFVLALPSNMVLLCYGKG